MKYSNPAIKNKVTIKILAVKVKLLILEEVVWSFMTLFKDFLDLTKADMSGSLSFSSKMS